MNREISHQNKLFCTLAFPSVRVSVERRKIEEENLITKCSSGSTLAPAPTPTFD